MGFIAFTDCIGPSNPTYLVDSLLSFNKKNNEEGNNGTMKKEQPPTNTVYMTKQQTRQIMETSMTTKSSSSQSSSNDYNSQEGSIINSNPVDDNRKKFNATLPPIDMSEKYETETMD